MTSANMMIASRETERTTVDGRFGLHLNHFLAGIFVYDFIATLGFDYDFISGKKKLKWPLSFYFANRYIMLAFFTLLLVLMNYPIERPINCQHVYAALIALSEFARGLASINLALRTIAVWSHNRIIIAGLCLTILGQWVIIINSARSVRAILVVTVGCVPLDTWYWGTVLFSYSMCFDFTVLSLNVYRLGFPIRTVGMRYSLKNLIFKQGLSYYIISFTVDLIAVIFLVVDPNYSMAPSMSVPAELLTTMVACHSVRSLTNMAYPTEPGTVNVPSALFFARPRSEDPSVSIHPSTQGRIQRLHGVEGEVMASTNAKEQKEALDV